MHGLNLVQTLAIAALPILFAITLHEVAHGFVAWRLGDPTAKMLGRLTINPIKHIDPIGTIVVPVLLLIMGGFMFGWAKPVPVTPQNLRSPKRDMAIVAIAGPASNLLMALFWALVAKLALVMGPSLGSIAHPLMLMGKLGILFNLLLMTLNLLPLPPLDGGRVLTGLLPGPLAWKFSRIEPYGIMILLGIIILSQGFGINILGSTLGPAVTFFETMLYALFRL
ncbi:MAG: site-2 protease family protein [Gammaproteobacteria bacterium]|nr:site-2 protease family protein [Gammaproteobacteria bacterium]MDH5593041.1 site-2 protease family protein [Gammaproteobacteria bacterium]